MKQKVVLAFSGGLDTSFCVPWLINEKGLEVHTVIVNTGGFSDDESKRIEERALTLGATSHTCIDAVDDYYAKGIRYLIFGNVLKKQHLSFVCKLGAILSGYGSNGACKKN